MNKTIRFKKDNKGIYTLREVEIDKCKKKTI
jgi:hypothetical protein